MNAFWGFIALPYQISTYYNNILGRKELSAYYLSRLAYKHQKGLVGFA